MSTKVLTRIIIGATVLFLIVIIYIFQTNYRQNKNQEVSSNPTPIKETETTKENENSMSTDRLSKIEDTISKLEDNIKDQESTIDDLSEKIATSSAESTDVTNKKILATTQTKGSTFSTTSTAYTPMNMFINITCPVRCTLWINFYSSSKNDSANNVNTYGVFLNGQDQSTYSQATLPVASGSAPISLNTAISVGAGTHTVEIQAKTSGGTLRSDVSFLQVMAIEQ